MQVERENSRTCKKGGVSLVRKAICGMGVPAFVAQQKFAETLSLPVSGDNIGDSGVVHFYF